MIRPLLAVVLLAGCSTRPEETSRLTADPEASADAGDFRRKPGAASSRLAGSVLATNPALVRLAEPARVQPDGALLVARDPALRPVALLRVTGRRGAVASVEVARGALRPGLEVVEPSPALAEEAGRLPETR